VGMPEWLITPNPNFQTSRYTTGRLATGVKSSV